MQKNDENIEGETITLEYPFEWAEENISEIFIPRPKAFHIRGLNFKKIEGGDGDEVLKLIQKLTGHPPKFVDKIDIADFQKMGEVIAGFFPESPQTGKNA